jgi:3-oxoacyl-[acyl-carrier protein] reductase
MSGFDFSDAMVVVTGAGAGIGQGIAQAFHAAGGRVALGDLRKDAVERAAAGLGGERLFAGVVDVRDEKSVQAFFAAAERWVPSRSPWPTPASFRTARWSTWRSRNGTA